jgi:hypothetical protein
MSSRLALLLCLLLAAGRAGAEGDAAVIALRRDPSLKVRTQAAIVLGQRGSPEAIAALREAVADDKAPSVRLAAVSALGRLQARAARGTLQAAAQADPDGAVRTAAVRAEAALGPVTISVEEGSGPTGQRLGAAVAAQLRQRGLQVAPQGELKVKPKVTVDVVEAGGKTSFEARASLVVIDGDGRIDLLETRAKATVAASVPEARRLSYVQKVVDAAGKGLGDDLAARLGGR